MNDPTTLSKAGVEVWRDVPGFEGMYRVSNLGNVESYERTIIRADGQVRRYGGQRLKCSPDAWGYPRVTLSRPGGIREYHKVFYLVYETFVRRVPSGLVLRHLDDIKTNSRLYNLDVGTYSDNLADAKRNGIAVGFQRGNRNGRTVA